MSEQKAFTRVSVQSHADVCMLSHRRGRAGVKAMGRAYVTEGGCLHVPPCFREGLEGICY